ncbi:UNVERIFIED_CONTAM: hypothetical protein HDU68_003349, partial [Siphonaria sp. JEL0065]
MSSLSPVLVALLLVLLGYVYFAYFHTAVPSVRDDKDKDEQLLSATERTLLDNQLKALKPKELSESNYKDPLPNAPPQPVLDSEVATNSRNMYSPAEESSEFVDKKEIKHDEEHEQDAQAPKKRSSSKKGKKKGNKKKGNKKPAIEPAVVDEEEFGVVETGTDNVSGAEHQEHEMEEAVEREQQKPSIDIDSITAPLLEQINSQQFKIVSLESLVNSSASSLQSLQLEFGSLKNQLKTLEKDYSKVLSDKQVLEETNRVLVKCAQDVTAVKDVLNKELVVLRSTAQTTSTSETNKNAKELEITKQILTAKNAELARLTDLVQVLTTSNQEIRDNWSKEVSALQGAHLEGVESVKKTMGLHFEEVSKGFELQFDFAQKALKDVSGELEKVKSGHIDEVEAIKGAHAANVESIKGAHVAEIESIKAAHTTQVESIKFIHTTEFETVRAAHNTEVESIKSIHAVELDTIRGNHTLQSESADIEALKAAHAAELESLTAEIEALTQERNDLEDELDQVLENLETLKATHAESFQQIMSSYNTARESLKEDYTAQIDELQKMNQKTLLGAVERAYVRAKESLQAAHKDELEILKREHEERVEAVKESVEEKEKALAWKYLSEVKAERVVLVKEHEKVVALLKESIASASAATPTVVAVDSEEIVLLRREVTKKNSGLIAAGQKLVELESTFAALKSSAAALAGSPVVEAAKDIATTPQKQTVSPISVVDIAPLENPQSQQVINLYETLAGQLSTIASLGTSLEDASLSKAEFVAKTIHQRVSHPELVANIVKPVRSDSPVGSLIHKFEDVIHSQQVSTGGSSPKASASVSPVVAFSVYPKVAAPKFAPVITSVAPKAIVVESASPKTPVPVITPPTVKQRPFQAKQFATPAAIATTIATSFLPVEYLESGLYAIASAQATAIEIQNVSGGKSGLFAVNYAPVAVEASVVVAASPAVDVATKETVVAIPTDDAT